jgi:murein DD-endopeptidase MepM/ murein hydrolase activator NlpD
VTAAAPSSPSLAVVPQNAYVHVVASGESLYTIARRYNVGPQQIVQANGFAAPDRIFVGQKLIIPGQSAQMPTNSSTPVAAPQPATTRVANVAPQAQTPAPALVKPQTQPAPAQQAVAAPPAQQQPAPTAQPVPQQAAAPAAPVAQQPAQQVANTGEPKMSGAEKFRWPASGKVIVDFSASKGTGINIELPEGAAVRAVENGTVIYVGSGVEGYGNLVLIRHDNGFVSAYAHNGEISVKRGDKVKRGQVIAKSGQSGNVTSPQLHFELRKGSTPVDPIPHLDAN